MAKLPKEEGIEISEPATQSKERKPTVFLRIPAGEVDGVKIGDMVTARFRGKVVGVDIHESENEGSRAHLDLEDPSVTVESSDNQIESLDEDLDE